MATKESNLIHRLHHFGKHYMPREPENGLREEAARELERMEILEGVAKAAMKDIQADPRKVFEIPTQEMNAKLELIQCLVKAGIPFSDRAPVREDEITVSAQLVREGNFDIMRRAFQEAAKRNPEHDRFEIRAIRG